MQKKNPFRIGIGLIVLYILVLTLFIIKGFREAGESAYPFLPASLMALLGILLLPFIYKISLASSLPNQQSKAVLIAKTAIRRGSRYPRSIWYQYVLTFRLSDRSILRMTVPESMFHSVVESDTGILVYRQRGSFSVFINFVKD
ncbi:MAG: hypothetical protein J6R77_06825 [Clostridia bacterium]|nr:hypothetical protein [Clostridia bacterium]